MMRLIIRSLDKQPNPELTEAVRRQVLLALASYAPRIARVSVSLRPDHTAGSAAHACQLALQLRGGEKAVITQLGNTQLDAVLRSASRAVSWVRRQLLVRHGTQVMPPFYLLSAHRSRS